jgi:hypothetical protein
VIATLLVVVMRLTSKVGQIADKLVAAQVSHDEDSYARFLTLLEKQDQEPKPAKPSPATQDQRDRARKVI